MITDKKKNPFPLPDDADDADPDASRQSTRELLSHLNVVDRFGVKMEVAFQRFFRRWGLLMADYPVPVILLSVGVCCVLLGGIERLQVTPKTCIQMV